MIAIVSICILAFVLILVMNTRYFDNTASINITSNYIKSQNTFNDWIISLVPEELKTFISKNKIYLQESELNIYKDFYRAIVVTLIILFSFLLLRQSYLLFLSVLPMLGFSLDLFIRIQSGKKSFLASLEHLVSCLEILTIKSEIALANSLKVISASLPNEYYVAKKELNQIIENSEKFGMEQCLLEIDTDSNEIQEFFSILKSIYKGTNKNALKKNVEDFIQRQKVIAEEKRKLFIDNMQLYLILPGTVIMMLAVYPLTDMILYMMRNSLR